MITIVDYGMGNIGSVMNMLDRIGISHAVASGAEQILAAEKLILPGVGAFGAGMESLRRKGLVESLEQKVKSEKIPVLGICLGMQLMTRSSEEDPGTPGLGWVNAETLKFRFEDLSLKVPHMGWNNANVNLENPLVAGDDEKRFYFVHSYYVKLDNQQDEILGTFYGHPFTSGFRSGNIFGVQFHPEKSHRFGLELLSGFGKL